MPRSLLFYFCPSKRLIVLESSESQALNLLQNYSPFLLYLLKLFLVKGNTVPFVIPPALGVFKTLGMKKEAILQYYLSKCVGTGT